MHQFFMSRLYFTKFHIIIKKNLHITSFWSIIFILMLEKLEWITDIQHLKSLMRKPAEDVRPQICG